MLASQAEMSGERFRPIWASCYCIPRMKVGGIQWIYELSHRNLLWTRARMHSSSTVFFVQTDNGAISIFYLPNVCTLPSSPNNSATNATNTGKMG